MRIGIIADTHGLLRPEAVEALRGVDAIVHAGDVGGAHVLDGLRALAPSVGIIDDGRAEHIALDERSKEALVKRMNQLKS